MTGTTFLDEEVTALGRRGVKVHSVAYEVKGKPSEFLSVHVVPVKWQLPATIRSLWSYCQSARHPSLSAPRLSERLRLMHVQSAIERAVVRHRIQLIHSHWARPDATGGVLAAERAGVPLVMTLHGADVLTEPSIGYGQTLNPWACGRIKYALSKAARVIVASECVAERAVELGALPSRVRLIRRTLRPARRMQARTRLALAAAVCRPPCAISMSTASPPIRSSRAA